MREIEKIIIHCSASDYESQSAAWIDKIHRTEKGMNSIGYHYFIRKNGLVERGRPLEQVGAHAYRNNQKSVGICLAGLEVFNPDQFESLRTVLNFLSYIPQLRHAVLIPHNAVNSAKTCPNFNVKSFRDYWELQKVKNSPECKLIK